MAIEGGAMDRETVIAEELLKLCHAYLRGAEINTPAGSRPIDKDELARLINLYLNDQSTKKQTHDQDQRNPASPVNQALA